MISLIANRYTLGIAAVGYFVYPWIATHVALFENIAATLARFN